ncbi:MAG TPA: hypothetical protein VFP93_05500, partial [Gammaproteobacteria bacterium]|nr:hypothetical protein [Gammaproteobacteria bacterium]
KERISTFLKTYCSNFSFKEHLTIEENISENIRALKVKRAKNHKTLTELSDEIAHLESQQNTWQGLCRQYPQLSTTTQWIDAWSQLLTIFGSKLLHGVKLLSSRQGSKTYFDITFYNTADLKMAHTIDKKFDLLIVTHAHDFSLPLSFKLLRQAQKALIFGHPKLTLSYPIVLSDIDSLALKTLMGIATEEVLEDLQYKGKVLSQTSLYYLAEQQSYYKQYDPTGLYYDRPLAFSEIWCQPNLAAFYKTYIDKKCIVHPLLGAGLKFFHIIGEVLDQEGWFNPKEADCLITWLKENSADNLAIITLSNAQKIYLEEQCRMLACSVPVYLLKNCPEHRYKTILFSPVYTLYSPRPFLLDCGDAMLYRVLSRAKESLIIFADTRIFDEKTHSPTGNLAKIMPQLDAKSMTM